MRYQERLWAPVGYWLAGLFFGLTTISAITFSFGDLALIAGVLGSIVGVGWALLGWGSLRLAVSADAVSVGTSVLEWPYLARVDVLDQEATRLALGRDGDPRAFLAIRPYVEESVRLTIDDAADPHPCWLVSSRRPHEFAQAILAAASAAGQVGLVESKSVDSPT